MKNKKKKINPELKQVLTELEEVVERLGYKMRYEKGNFEGGYCVLKDSRLIVINSRNEIEKRITIASKCLKEIGINDIFVTPHLREIIDAESSRKVTTDNDSENDETADESNEEINEEAENQKSL